ncbi:MAG: T9SS type A sorting domain-containing protein [Chitinophagales bacterium]|nr:T9SS type A sorting domain-containing protein [Chitinophagales bacterium]
MKKLIFTLLIASVIGMTEQLKAQCEIKDAVIGIVSTSQAGVDCQTTFNLSFKLKNNGGNKTVVIQAWKEADYPNYWGANCSNNQSPRAADLRLNGTGPLPFLNIAFDIATQTVIASANYPGGGVTLGSGYTVAVGTIDALGFYPITLSNLSVTVPNQQCGNGVTIRADVWSSQGSVNSGWTPHCVICNNTYAFNYPAVTASLNCLNPRGYFVRIQNINTVQTITSSWKAYRDDNNNGILDPTDPLVDDQSGTSHTITAGTSYQTTGFIPYTGNTTPPAINQNLIIEVTTDGLANKQYAIAANACAPLPVNFKSFNADRIREWVNLRWETMTEQNSSSFVIERTTGLTGWQTVAVIPSQATGGNSNDLLTYHFADLNNYKGISQYRIRQVDLDNQSRYSVVKAVRGESQPVKLTVFPNPSENGKVTVVFDNSNTVRELTLLDMSGRIIRRMTAVTNNSVQFDNLSTGIYSLRVVAVETGEQTISKVVVNRK